MISVDGPAQIWVALPGRVSGPIQPGLGTNKEKNRRRRTTSSPDEDDDPDQPRFRPPDRPPHVCEPPASTPMRAHWPTRLPDL
eukprot:maker-scaffold99_size374999-snap-gene-1.8 protein:Tk10055 transcript:maker-scaffold99_size374999-snap-gene-1.8-mRNA-1 annotation:"brefeldin a-inhibited guanine nucleotide-exchange protein 1-like"